MKQEEILKRQAYCRVLYNKLFLKDNEAVQGVQYSGIEGTVSWSYPQFQWSEKAKIANPGLQIDDSRR